MVGDLKWARVKLIRLQLPEAEVEVLEAAGHGQRVTVGVDDLRPDETKKEKEKEAKRQKTAHPALQEVGELLKKYEYQECEAPCLHTLTKHLVMQAHLATISSVERVYVSLLCPKGKLLIVTQVRANEGVNKGPAHPSAGRRGIALVWQRE